MKLTTVLLGLIFTLFLLLLMTVTSIMVFGHEASPSAKKIYTVHITSEGFQPHNLEIEKGETVRWENLDDKLHWPASDPHPSHEYFSEFDPQIGLEKNHLWSFTFTKVGTWYYHDHFNPHRTGKIVVRGDTSNDNTAASITPEASKKDIPTETRINKVKRKIHNWLVSLLNFTNLISTKDIEQGEDPDEIQLLLSEKNTAKQNTLVRKLLEKYPPREVQEMLKNSGLPFTGESHFVIHTVGDWLYEQYGVKGLPLCTDYFLSGCFHGLILHELGDHGTERITEMMEVCKKSGNAVVAQCAHGLGHGFLAWQDYNLVKAFEMCDIFEGNPYEFNCHDGVSMENIVAAYDSNAKAKRWIKKDDPLYPCNVVPDKYKPGCWSNQATLMLIEIFNDLNKVVEQCDKLSNSQYKSICYNNLARQMQPMAEGSAEKAVYYCRTYPTGLWQEECLLTNMSASFSVGDRDDVPYKLCDAISASFKFRCYNDLHWLIVSYFPNKNERRNRCNKIHNDIYKQDCLMKTDSL